MKLYTLTEQELDSMKKQVTMSSLSLESKTTIIQTINNIIMQSKDGFTLYQLGYAKGYVAGINTAAGNPAHSAKETYDAYVRSMDKDYLNIGNQ